MAKILVVDDEEFNRDMLSRRLTRKSYDVLVADSGKQALDILDKNEIDLVLLDIRMPGMDGNEVLSIIRKNYTPIELPVIMVTAEVDSKTMIKSLGLGADDYVTKPIDLPVLLARIESKLVIAKSVKDQLKSSENKQEKNPDLIEEIHQLIKTGENQNVEFKSTLRWNIHAGKIGKEIEFAWIKTIAAFLNTDGGTLLIGVDDEGIILGNELDKFKSDDKYLLHVNNTIKDNIGMECAGSIRFDLVNIENKQVLYIKCESHTEPVFIKDGNDEAFYVRLGPGSRKLSTKEVLSFLASKK